MEGREEGLIEPTEPPSENNKEEWISDWLDELCPYYMFLGVSCEEFWHGDYTVLKYYVRADELHRQKMSEELWMAGLYNFNAVSTALSNFHFDGKKHKVNRYMEEPIRLIPLTETEKKVKAKKERQKTIDYFNRLAAKWGQKSDNLKSE